jgi:hypothetical protein
MNATYKIMNLLTPCKYNKTLKIIVCLPTMYSTSRKILYREL